MIKGTKKQKNARGSQTLAKTSQVVKIPRGMKQSYSADKPRAIKMHYAVGGYINAAVPDAFGSFEFQLDQFSGYADLAAVFDAYRLTKVSVEFFPRSNTHNLAITATATTQNCPPIVTVIDYDDSNTPSSMTELEQFTTYKVHESFRPFKVTFRPRPALALYAGGVTPGYAQASPDTWIDCANDDVAHYGLKWGVFNGSASQTSFQAWKVVVTGWFEFRQPR